jgi:hypothetical protein
MVCVVSPLTRTVSYDSYRASYVSHSQLELECDLGKLGELFGGNRNFGCFVDKQDN